MESSIRACPSHLRSRENILDPFSDNQPTTKKTVGCCSYRAKTSEKYSGYEHLHDLSFRNLYMGFVRSTTAHGLPRIHEANGM